MFLEKAAMAGSYFDLAMFWRVARVGLMGAAAVVSSPFASLYFDPECHVIKSFLFGNKEGPKLAAR